MDKVPRHMGQRAAAEPGRLCMDAVTTIERYWYSLVAIPLAIIGIIYVFLPLFTLTHPHG